MIIPLWVDKNKDSELISFLETQTNKSATIRNIIYNYMRGISYKTEQFNDKVDLDNSFINSLNSFDLGDD